MRDSWFCLAWQSLEFSQKLWNVRLFLYLYKTAHPLQKELYNRGRGQFFLCYWVCWVSGEWVKKWFLVHDRKIILYNRKSRFTCLLSRLQKTPCFLHSITKHTYINGCGWSSFVMLAWSRESNIACLNTTTRLLRSFYTTNLLNLTLSFKNYPSPPILLFHQISVIISNNSLFSLHSHEPRHDPPNTATDKPLNNSSQ